MDEEEGIPVEVSEDEADIILPTVSNTRSKFNILDSDSDSEPKESSKNNSNEKVTSNLPAEHSEEDLPKLNKSRNKFNILDSDSDSEIKASSEGGSNVEDKDSVSHVQDEAIHKTKLKRITTNNDSELSDDEVTPHNKSFPDEEAAGEAVIYTTNKKGELVPENSPTVSIQKSRFAALCDSPSSEEEERELEDITKNIEEKVVQPIAYKPSKRNKKDDKPKKMTAQEAAKQRIEIQSESQRMLREKSICLPYHKSKSYTLKEFLEKRAKLPSAMPLMPKVPPSLAIKMSKDKLEEISKKVDERMKQVEEFYKSDSGSDCEDENIEKVSKEFRSWIDLLVDNAVDTVESKNNEETATENRLQSDPPQEQSSMDYDFSLEDINEEESPKKNITELLSERVLNIQPKLSGGPDDIIDLDEAIVRPSGVKKLVEKFFQHIGKKQPHRHKVHLNIVGVSGGGEIVQETVSMNVDEEEEPAVMEKPGAKLQKLREELQNQMAQRRSELWKQKQDQGECLEVEKKLDPEGEKEKDILDDDEEEDIEMSETETEDEEDDEEDCMTFAEKPKTKSAFIEDEASLDEPDEENDPDNDEEEEKGEFDDDNNDGFDGDDEEEVREISETENSKKKILKRIIKPFTEDSDEEDEEPSKDIAVVRTTKKSNDSDEDEIIPPNLPRINITPQRHRYEANNSDFDFFTPVSFLTGLQNLSADRKFLKDSPDPEPSPVKEQSSSHKKLFSESSDQSQDSQNNTEDLAEVVASGKFPQMQNSSDLSVDVIPSTQDLLNVCTGGFSSSGEIPQTQISSPDPKLPEDAIPSTQDLLNVCSGGFSSLPENTSNQIIINIQTNPEKEIKSLDEDYGQIISQLLDEEEMENFKKKFESPVANAAQKNSNLEEDAEEVNATGLINSDDENDGLEIKKKKTQKKLIFSDDEESLEDNEDEPNPEEEIDLHDSDDEEQLLENEVKAQESAKYKISDFLDKEAELSESEWGSEDEDEKGLDDLEFEQGDQEVFNENKVRSELERIHMRQVLDEDNREVKLLQELLLEDGELHGSGRQRQFRWKALDSMESSEFENRDDDDIYLDEEESEEQWRKMRHKREMFLKKNSTTEDVDSILSDSKILKIGQQVFKNSQSFNSQNNTPAEKTEAKVKEPFNLLSKRGSFLSRKDQVLQRLAEYNKVTESVTGTTAKNSRCFVFQTVETSEATVIKNNNNKRKAADGTPAAIKKLRLDNWSPAAGKKIGGKSSKAKKLFGNW